MMRRPAWLPSVLVFVPLVITSCSSEATHPGGAGLFGTGAAGAGGGPAATCPVGTTLCAGSCVSLQTDAAHCGACGAACAADMTCQVSACACRQGLSPCASGCADLQGNGNNCGACGLTCPAGQVCSAGQCGSSCSVPGETACDNNCVNLSSDAAHCGSCATPCAVGQSCQNGVCSCPSGQQLCGGACVDPALNSLHCGGCGQACASGLICIGALCTDGSAGTGGMSGTGGAATGGVSSGGTSTGGIPSGGVGTGGTPNTGGAPGTGGVCTNIRPTGTQWDEATCDQWATQTSECAAAWMADSNYCNESCGRCGASGTGGIGTGGGSTGGTSSGGSPSTGGVSGSGPTFHVFLLLGQSNMEGYPKAQQADRVEDSRIRVLGYDSCSATGRQTNQWDVAAPPLHSCWNDGLGPGDHFAKTLIQVLPAGDSIGLVPCAINGERIETFMKVGGSKYSWIIQRAQLAQQAGGAIEGILFHQGESNNGDSSWPGKVNTLVTDLRNDLGLGSVPFLAGELLHSGSCAGHNRLVNELPSVVTNAHVVSASGLVEDPSDATYNLHFDHDSQVTLGRRYAEKLISVLGW